MISASWPMPEKQVEPTSRVVIRSISFDPSFSLSQKSFDPSPFLKLYNDLDTLSSPKAGKPTVKGAIYVSKEQLPPQIFSPQQTTFSNIQVAALFGIPSDYLSSITISIDPQPFSDMPLFADYKAIYKVEIERYLSNDEPF
jgi:hypothetical protein